MDNPKTALVKSKSSNSTSEAKRHSSKSGKTSRSNAEFQPRTTMCMGTQPLMLKKRGVYVAKKPSKISITNTKRSPDVPPRQPTSSPPRPIPRPSKKRFLTSVLTILSKSTAGTQCPDTEGTRKMDKTKLKLKMRRDEEDIREEWTTSPNVSKKKNKYKSRILKSKANRELVTVLPSNKEIAQTSSNNSEYINVKYAASSVDPVNVKWPKGLPPLGNDGIVSAATRNKKVRLIQKDSEPSTSIADTPEINDKSFYDFFVDMLKTTMNVYNVETDLEKQHLPNSAKSSTVTLLEMKESVAKKKKMPKVEDMKSQSFDLSRKPSSQHAYSIMPDLKDELINRQLMEQFQIQSSNKPAKKKKKKINHDYFQYKKADQLPMTISLPMPSKKKTTKKDPKKDFLKLLTKELREKADKFEEPENFYQALKVIAKKKRRSQEWKNQNTSEEDDHVCQFKRRSVLSRKPSSKQSSNYTEPSRSVGSTRQPFPPTYKKRKVIKEQHGDETDYESNHSLEVVGYDYDIVKPHDKKPKKKPVSLLSRPLTPPSAIEDYSTDFWNDYSDSDTGPMTMLEQRQYVLDKLGQL